MTYMKIHQDDKEFFSTEVDKDLDEVEKTLSKFKKHKPDPSKVSNFKRKNKSKNNVIKFSDYKQDVTNDGR